MHGIKKQQLIFLIVFFILEILTLKAAAAEVFTTDVLKVHEIYGDRFRLPDRDAVISRWNQKSKESFDRCMKQAEYKIYWSCSHHYTTGSEPVSGTWYTNGEPDSVHYNLARYSVSSEYPGREIDIEGQLRVITYWFCPDNFNRIRVEENGKHRTYECQQVAPMCEPPTRFNTKTGLCEKECPIDKPWDSSARDCIAPPEPENCSNEAGNPINFFNGHKLQRETVFEAEGDFPLTFTWFYNSFGNQKKSGAGFSIGEAFLNNDEPTPKIQTVLHTEPEVMGRLPRISLPLGKKNAMERQLEVGVGNYFASVNNNWRHNHSLFLAHYTLPERETERVTERVIAYRPNGKDLHFKNENGIFVAEANRDWRVKKALDENGKFTGWELKSSEYTETYDSNGRILRVENQQGQGITYTYNEVVAGPSVYTITDDNGNSMNLIWSGPRNLLAISRNDGSTYRFGYTNSDLLQSITFPDNDNSKRIFRYEDSRFPNALTGVTDEAGNVYSTFTYDDQGRAIRTEHNGGAESVDVEYVDKNTRRLTNALDKKTTYNYSDVHGVKRITSVEGEASANCAAANMNYSYDANGFVASETDWEGNTTTYTRDNLGRELTRTEAAGTPEAKVITTEWHDTLNLPKKVITFEGITEYTYDTEGRLLSKKVTPAEDS
ncbi:DUF6531 domain-containing protein [Microbulbifer sp. 2304DJ12-6]|uniref:DUF6531 domain-containing protein n=1 Tax=Microbulbifer sp. 2304DJ12-6 TaxID=3233340 RepID=UPI0039B0690E